MMKQYIAQFWAMVYLLFILFFLLTKISISNTLNKEGWIFIFIALLMVIIMAFVFFDLNLRLSHLLSLIIALASIFAIIVIFYSKLTGGIGFVLIAIYLILLGKIVDIDRDEDVDEGERFKENE